MAHIAAGSIHSVIVDHNASLWVCGGNKYGQLGYFSLSKFKTKVKMLGDIPPVLSVTAGNCSSFFIDNENQAWGFGSNIHGELGLNKRWKAIYRPTKIKNPKKVKSVAFGYLHSLFLDEDGNVWSCGSNEQGQLGLEDNLQRKKPEKIEGLPPIKSVSCGYYFSTFLDINGVIWTTGLDQPVFPPKAIMELDRIREVSSDSYSSMFITENDNLILYDGQQNKTPIVADIPPVKQAGGSLDWAVFIDHEGSVWNARKQLSHNPYKPNQIAFSKNVRVEQTIGPLSEVAVGDSHIICTTPDGSVYTWKTTGSWPHVVNKLPGIVTSLQEQSNVKSARNVT